jgi:hypothetical protein
MSENTASPISRPRERRQTWGLPLPAFYIAMWVVAWVIDLDTQAPRKSR